MQTLEHKWRRFKASDGPILRLRHEGVQHPGGVLYSHEQDAMDGFRMAGPIVSVSESSRLAGPEASSFRPRV